VWLRCWAHQKTCLRPRTRIAASTCNKGNLACYMDNKSSPLERLVHQPMRCATPLRCWHDVPRTFADAFAVDRPCSRLTLRVPSRSSKSADELLLQLCWDEVSWQSVRCLPTPFVLYASEPWCRLPQMVRRRTTDAPPGIVHPGSTPRALRCTSWATPLSVKIARLEMTGFNTAYGATPALEPIIHAAQVQHTGKIPCVMS
jgi:hypothetical protein